MSIRAIVIGALVAGIAFGLGACGPKDSPSDEAKAAAAPSTSQPAARTQPAQGPSPAISTRTRTNMKDGAEMVRVPAGEFTMGSNDGDDHEKPVHKVYLDEYYIYKHEVTVAQFKRFCQATRHKMSDQPDWNKDNHPVVNVTWHDAAAYAKWAGASLPTEAQWEKAARGTDGRTYPWGNEAPNAGGKYRCNCDPGDNAADGYEYTAPVGSFASDASPYGCLDMAGNVWEWCADRYDDGYYSKSPARNPTGPRDGKLRVLRGGSWFILSKYVRAALRGRGRPSRGGGFVGFRCVVASR